jgi:hypothetical protein
MTSYSVTDQHQLEAGISKPQAEIVVFVEKEDPLIETTH